MDHNRVNVDPTLMSCGVRQLSRISEELPEVLFAIANMFYHPSRGVPPAFVLWSDVAYLDTSSSRLAETIRERKLGDVTMSKISINPITGNHICIWVWTIDHEKFKQFYGEQKILKVKKTLLRS